MKLAPILLLLTFTSAFAGGIEYTCSGGAGEYIFTVNYHANTASLSLDGESLCENSTFVETGDLSDYGQGEGSFLCGMETFELVNDYDELYLTDSSGDESFCE